MYKLTPKQILELLMEQVAFTLHKPIRRNFKRNLVLVSVIDEQWQMDLADITALPNIFGFGVKRTDTLV